MRVVPLNVQFVYDHYLRTATADVQHMIMLWPFASRTGTHLFKRRGGYGFIKTKTHEHKRNHLPLNSFCRMIVYQRGH